MGSAPLQYLSHILHFQCSLASGKRKCRKYFLDFEHRSICRRHCSASSVLRLEAAYSHRSSEYVKKKLRHRIYEHLLKVGEKYEKTFSTSEILQVAAEGVEQLEIYFGKYLPQLFYSLLAPITLFILVSFMSVKVALILFLCVPLIPASIIAIQKFAKKLLAKYWGSYVQLGRSFS